MKKLKKVLSLILAVAMAVTYMPVTSFAASSVTQPFSSGTGGSTNFRIPAMATTISGEIIAATDARYTGTGDGYGLDTMVRYSMNNGTSWSDYKYVNYNDDSTGYNDYASAFIDPSLAVKGSTVYLFAGLYPGGKVYIGNCKSGTGYTTVNGESVLALYDSTNAASSTDPSYYVSNTANSDGYYPIYNYSSKTATQYYVDGNYDIYTINGSTYTAVTGTQIDSSKTINANIFYTGNANTTGMYVLGTYFLTLRKGTISSDGSISWGDLKILNGQVKGSGESFYGIGPGGATVTTDGTIVVPMYTYANSADGKSSVITSTDGDTWTRGADLSYQTSEASVSEVNVNGTNTLYMFTRHGNYIYKSTNNGSSWSYVGTAGVSYNNNCEVSTLTYSKKIDGCPAILLSAPTGKAGSSNGRDTGYIYVGLVQTDGSITWKYSKQVNSGTYQYSDIVELSDGSIGVLYENGSASELFATYAITDIVGTSAVIGDSEETTTVTYTAKVSSETVTEGNTITLSATASDGSSTSATTWASSDSSVLSVSGTTATGVKAGTATLTATLPDKSTQTFEITVAEKTTDPDSGDGDGDEDTTSATDKTVQKTETEVAGGTVYQLDTDGIDDGAEYVIVSNNASPTRAMYNISGTSTTDQWTCTLSDTGFDADTTVTFTVGNEDYLLWTVGKSDSGYTIKGNNSGTYVNLATATTSTTKVNLTSSTTGTVLTIDQDGTGYNVSYKTTSWNSISMDKSNYSSYKNGTYYYKSSGSYYLINDIWWDYSTSMLWLSYTVNGTTTSAYKSGNKSFTIYEKADVSNYLVHETSNQFYTSSSTSGNTLYFFKKTTTTAGTTTTYTADNSTLSSLIATASGLSSSDYTEDSFATLTEALTAAKAVASPTAYDNAEDAQDEQDAINAAAKKLSDAIKALVQEKNVTVTVGESVTASAAGILDSTGLDTSIATVTLNAGTLTVNGVAVGKTSVTVNGVIYNIVVKEKSTYVTVDNTPFIPGTGVGSTNSGSSGKLTKLTLSEGLTYDVNFDSSITVKSLVMEDTSIATVASDGTITGVKAGTTKLIMTDTNGNTYEMPVVILAAPTSSSTKICDLHITELTNTEAWYSWNCSGDADEFVQVVDGEAIYVAFNKSDAYCINFYAKPDSGYALQLMTASGSAGNYASLQDKSDATACDFYTQTGAGLNERGYSIFGDTAVANDITVALEKGCDGAQGFSRSSGSGGTGDVNCDLSFRSEKLPTVTKTVKSVNGKAYTEGMTTTSGDTIVYEITVNKYAVRDLKNSVGITYTDVTLTDNLDGAVFEDTSSNKESITIASDGNVATYTYLVDYTVKDTDLDTTITNTVDLKYSYVSALSSGTFDSSANATAKLSAVSINQSDVVVDFGLPVEFDYSSFVADGSSPVVSGKAVYGDIDVDTENNVVTYIPNQILQGIDTVTLTNAKGTEFTFKVYPASTVYYEASDAAEKGFLSYSDNWNVDIAMDEADGQDNQNTAVLGKDQNNYGYDKAYAEPTLYDVVGTSTTSADKASFTFTGTGADVYANCSKKSGYLFFMVKDASGKLVKVLNVNTASINGDSSLTTYPEGTLYNVPVASLTGLDYGTYSVTITHVKDGSEVVLDGVKIYGTIAEDDNTSSSHTASNCTSPYLSDDEDHASFIEVRDLNFGTLDLTTYNSKYTKTTYTQVYDKIKDTQDCTAVLTSSDGSEVKASQDLIDNGPKNEIYLYPGMSLTLNLDTAREVQLGLRGLQKSLECNIGSETQKVSTTDMFYTVKAKGSTGTIIITNPSGNTGILAVTKLKVCDDPTFCPGEITSENIYDTLDTLGMIEHDKEHETEEETKAPETTAPEETKAPETTAPEETKAPETKAPSKCDRQITLKDKTCTYTGHAIQCDAAKVSGTSCKVTYTYYSNKACTKKLSSAPVKPGTYYVVASTAATSKYNAAKSKVATLTIKKAAQKVTVKYTTKTCKATSCKKAACKLALTISAKGKVTCKKVSGSSKLTVSTAGKISVKKGTKKGTYTMKVKFTAAATTCYNAASCTKTIKVVVK